MPLSSPSQAGNRNKVSTWKRELAFVYSFLLAGLFLSKSCALICCLLELPGASCAPEVPLGVRRSKREAMADEGASWRRREGRKSPSHVKPEVPCEAVPEQQAQGLGAVAAAQVLFCKSSLDSAVGKCQFWRKVRVL